MKASYKYEVKFNQTDPSPCHQTPPPSFSSYSPPGGARGTFCELNNNTDPR